MLLVFQVASTVPQRNDDMLHTTVQKILRLFLVGGGMRYEALCLLTVGDQNIHLLQDLVLNLVYLTGFQQDLDFFAQDVSTVCFTSAGSGTATNCTRQ